MSNLTRTTFSNLDVTSPAFSLTRELLRLCPGLAGDEKESVQAVIMAVLVAEQEGHTHLLLTENSIPGSLTQALQMVISPEAPPETAERIFRTAPALLRDPRLLTLIGKPGEHKPLILEGSILASHRSHLQEHHLNQLLLTRLESIGQASEPSVPHPSFSTLMARLSDEQRAAVQLAGQRLLTVISGGPGTGKTSIVSALIAHLCSRGMKPSEIGLAAPTGKAANRLEQAIQNSWPTLQAEDSPLAGHPPPTGMTLHRLIGAGRKAGRFSFHSGNPLPLKAVIVDEASMIDLSMMHNLLQALAPTCRLVLLGDADQLPAVENGAVFRDLVAPPEFQGRNPPWCARLTKSFRMREDDPQGSAILRLASFIRDGHEFPSGPDRGRATNAPATCRTRCHEITGQGPELLELPAAGKPVTTFLHWWFEAVWKWPPALQERLRHPFAWDSANIVSSEAADLEHLFSHFLSSRLLTATRQLATGTEALNRYAGLLYRHQLGRASHEEFIPGEPILMTRNDYLNDVFNGDQGLVLWATTPTSPKPSLHAVFPRHDGFQAIPFEAIRHDLEPAYALTVHKSQGSEFNQIFFLLPAGDHPLLTREILYTAVTRARKGVVLIGPREILNLALQRSISRLSRLTFPLQTNDESIPFQKNP